MSEYIGYEPMDGIEMTGPQRRSEAAGHLMDLPDELLLQIAAACCTEEDWGTYRSCINNLALVNRRLSLIAKEIWTREPSFLWIELPSFLTSVFSTQQKWNLARTRSLTVRTFDSRSKVRVRVGISDSPKVQTIVLDRHVLDKCREVIWSQPIGDKTKKEWQEDLDMGRFDAHFCILLVCFPELTALNLRQFTWDELAILESLMVLEDEHGYTTSLQTAPPNKGYINAVSRLVLSRIKELTFPDKETISLRNFQITQNYQSLCIGLKDLKSLTKLCIPISKLLATDPEIISLPPKLTTLVLEQIDDGDLEALIGPLLKHKAASPYLKSVHLRFSCFLSELDMGSIIRAINSIKEAGIRVWIDFLFPESRELTRLVSMEGDGTLQFLDLDRALSGTKVFKGLIEFPRVRERVHQTDLLSVDS